METLQLIAAIYWHVFTIIAPFLAIVIPLVLLDSYLSRRKSGRPSA